MPGWLVVEAEQDPRKAHPLTYARLGYHNLRAMTEEAGLKGDDGADDTGLSGHCERSEAISIPLGTAMEIAGGPRVASLLAMTGPNCPSVRRAA